MAKRTFKVTGKLSTGNSEYRKWSDWEVGDVLIGKLLTISTDRYDKNNYAVRVEEAMFKDKSGKGLSGKILTLNSSGKLDKALTDRVGICFQLTYKGMKAIEKGKFAGKDAHDMDIEEIEFADEDVDL